MFMKVFEDTPMARPWLNPLEAVSAMVLYRGLKANFCARESPEIAVGKDAQTVCHLISEAFTGPIFMRGKLKRDDFRQRVPVRLPDFLSTVAGYW